MRERVRQKYTPPAEPAEPDPKDEKAARKAEKEAERERERERRRLEKEARKPLKSPPPPPKPAGAAQAGTAPLPRPRPEGRLSLSRRSPSSTRASRPRRSTRTSSTTRSAGSRRSSRSSASRARSASTTPGPIITTYEFFPAPGIKVSPGRQPDRGPVPGPGGRVRPHPAHPRQIVAWASRSRTTSARSSSSATSSNPRSSIELAVQADLRPGQGRPRRRVRHGPGRHAPPPHRRLDGDGEERRPQRPHRQHPLQGHAGRGQARPHRPQAARVHALRGRPPPPLPGHQRPEEGPRRPHGHRPEDGGALQEAPERQGPEHRPVQHSR